MNARAMVVGTKTCRRKRRARNFTLRGLPFDRRNVRANLEHRPAAHEAHDVRGGRFLEFDSQRLLHKNEPVRGPGDRYAIVLFNKNMNYVGERDCARSCELAARGRSGVRWFEPRPEAEPERRALLAACAATPFPREKSYSYPEHGYLGSHSKYGGHEARVLSFGWIASRGGRAERAARGLRTKREANLNNARFAALYGALLRYAAAAHPGLFGETPRHRYTSCIVAKNSQCEWHRDQRNVGPAAITALGDFAGGRLLVEAEGG
jgi:hypothetical protein